MVGSGIAERAELALRVPLADALGCRVIDAGHPDARVEFSVVGLASNGAGGLHAAALAAAMELAAYLAVAPTLATVEHAVTHASAMQLIGVAHTGDHVQVRAELERRGRNIAFTSVAAHVEQRLIARAQITKSIVAADGSFNATPSA